MVRTTPMAVPARATYRPASTPACIYALQNPKQALSYVPTEVTSPTQIKVINLIMNSAVQV